MNPLVIVVPAIVILAGILLVAAARRRDTDDATGLLSRETLKRDRGESPVLVGAEQPTGREVERSVAIERRGDGGGELVTAGPADLAPYVPPDADAIGVTRRQFFNRSIVLLMGLSLSGFGAAILAFLWPQPKGGFGSKIRVGNVEDLKAEIAANNGFLYVAEGRMWLTQYPEAALERAAAAYDQPVLNSLEAGVAVLYQKCPHLGCRVPECETSQWFECPCHGSQYNQAGEKKGGPAPRGMDRFATEVTGGVLSVDTGAVIQGPPIGVNTTGQEAEGPNCVGAGSH
jgi:cytochrome b6-f complex iron-sulfur subunit